MEDNGNGSYVIKKPYVFVSIAIMLIVSFSSIIYGYAGLNASVDKNTDEIDEIIAAREVAWNEHLDDYKLTQEDVGECKTQTQLLKQSLARMEKDIAEIKTDIKQIKEDIK